MTENFRPTVLRNKAWEALRGKWGNSAAICLVLFAIIFAGMVILRLIGLFPAVDPQQPYAMYQSWGYWGSMLYNLFFASLIGMGALFMWLDVARGKKVEFNTLFEPFKDYGRYLCGVLLVFVFTFLWSLLFVIPGIIKAISYSQTYFIMRENPEMKANDAINLSMKMMKGHKMDFFLLGLSFIGWVLLGCITFGIGLLWVYPYIYTTMGEFYEEVKKSAV